MALFAGKMLGWNWFDPVMGLVGAVVITRWAYALLKETSPILLDECTEKDAKSALKAKIEADADNRVADLHLWKVGPDDYAAIISLVTHYPQPIEHYRKLLSEFKKISHLTIQVNQCIGEPCIVQAN
jgi:Co/Zn/Cd efflux system component